MRITVLSILPKGKTREDLEWAHRARALTKNFSNAIFYYNIV